MKMIQKKGERIAFNPEAFDYDTEYVVEVGGYNLKYRTRKMESGFYRGNNKKWEFGGCVIHFQREYIPSEPYTPPKNNYNDWRFNGGKYPTPPSTGVCETLSIPAEYVVDGVVKIYDNDGSLIKDAVVTEPIYGVSDDIKVGQIYKLTIDGDPRFNNTLIMIMETSTVIRFVYQTKVVYSPEFSRIECAEGIIDVVDFRSNEPFDTSSVHLELVQDVTDVSSVIDRTNLDEIHYPESQIGFVESYPAIEPRKRRTYNDDCDEYDD